MSSGQPKLESVNSQPEIIDPAAQAKVFGTAVMLAAAGRSDGVTTAITYEVLVGTSICDSPLRASNSAIVVARLGAKGIRINKTLDGRCVKTIVLMSPMRGRDRVQCSSSTPIDTPITAPSKNGSSRASFIDRRSFQTEIPCTISP